MNRLLKILTFPITIIAALALTVSLIYYEMVELKEWRKNED